MNPVEIGMRRSQMGRAARSMLTGGPAPVFDAGADFWIALSGAPSPDLNMALVSAKGSVRPTLQRLTESGVPALFMLTGECESVELVDPWEQVGEMPFMASTLDSTHLLADSRVRQAGPDDVGVACGLMSEAFGLATEVIIEVITGVLNETNGPTKVWILDADGVAVSAVLTSIVADAVTVWCMSTPERLSRRGFGKAILAHALCRAKEGGAHVGLLGATPAGKPLYDATGWHTLEYWRMFASAKSSQFNG